MQFGKWVFLVLAVLAAVFMALIGIAVAFRSILGMLGAIIGVIAVMGTGFVLKKRMREKGLLD
ncbi:YlaF family protein [Metabacillus herbersteinensis]|uniref:YlaF family protein n=1 Tax=Metabacillus herbersteinensis TaxID=283816 RepID=A0ABV6GLW3_9BACI